MRNDNHSDDANDRANKDGVFPPHRGFIHSGVSKSMTINSRPVFLDLLILVLYDWLASRSAASVLCASAEERNRAAGNPS
jgi:hypothetical protein